MDDLQQVASVGLVKAASRFDPTRGRSFASYAIPTVLGELRRHFRDCGWSVHVPRGSQERAAAVRDAREALTDEHGRAPTVQQIAQYLRIDVEGVLDGLIASQAYETASLDAPADEDRPVRTFADSRGAEDPAYSLVERRADVRAALETLEEGDRQVLRMRFGEELTQTEIGRRIGISQIQVSRVLRSVLHDLHDRVEGDPPAGDQ